MNDDEWRDPTAMGCVMLAGFGSVAFVLGLIVGHLLF